MTQRLDKLGRPQPSDEALTRLLKFLIKTSVPRIIAQQKADAQKAARKEA